MHLTAQTNNALLHPCLLVITLITTTHNITSAFALALALAAAAAASG